MALQLPPPLRGLDGGFTRKSIQERLVQILESVRESVLQIDSSLGPRLDRLAQELRCDTVAMELEPIDGDGPDLQEWNNRYLQNFGEYCVVQYPRQQSCWLELPWWVVECYFYRRLLGYTRYFLNRIDPFEGHKHQALEHAMPALQSLVLDLYGNSSEFDSTHFLHLIYCNLWSNRADLSFSGGKFQQHHQQHDSVSASATSSDKMLLLQSLEHERPHVILDHSRTLYDRLLKLKEKRGSHVTFIIDNCGLELACDLLMADELLRHNLVDRVSFHLKAHPIFVSDALVKDVKSTLDRMAIDPDNLIQGVAARLRGHLTEGGRFELHEDLFFNSILPFWKLPSSSALFQRLAGCDLVMCKGDANYRRLIGDLWWDPTTTRLHDILRMQSSDDANGIQQFQSFPSPSIAVLRTLKSEAVTDIPASQMEVLTCQDPAWRYNGRWGVIQFVDLSH